MQKTRRTRRREALKEAKAELKRLGIPRRRNKGLLHKNITFYLKQSGPKYPDVLELDVRGIFKSENKYFEV